MAALPIAEVVPDPDPTVIGYDAAVQEYSGSETVRAVQNKPTQRRMRVHPRDRNGCALLSGGMTFEPLPPEPAELLPVVRLHTPYHPELHHARTWIPNRRKPEDKDERGKTLQLKVKHVLPVYDPEVDRPERHVSNRSPKNLELISDRRSAGYYRKDAGHGQDGNHAYSGIAQAAQDASNPELHCDDDAVDSPHNIAASDLERAIWRKLMEVLDSTEVYALHMRLAGWSDAQIKTLQPGKITVEQRSSQATLAAGGVEVGTFTLTEFDPVTKTIKRTQQPMVTEPMHLKKSRTAETTLTRLDKKLMAIRPDLAHLLRRPSKAEPLNTRGGAEFCAGGRRFGKIPAGPVPARVEARLRDAHTDPVFTELRKTGERVILLPGVAIEEWLGSPERVYIAELEALRRHSSLFSTV